MKQKYFFEMPKKNDLLKNDILLVPINIKNEHWALLVLYPKLGEAINLNSLLSFSDISETLRPFFQYINCYCKLHSIEKNWEILVHNGAPKQKNDIDCRVNQPLFEWIQSFDGSG